MTSAVVEEKFSLLVCTHPVKALSREFEVDILAFLIEHGLRILFTDVVGGLRRKG